MRGRCTCVGVEGFEKIAKYIVDPADSGWTPEISRQIGEVWANIYNLRSDESFDPKTLITSLMKPNVDLVNPKERKAEINMQSFIVDVVALCRIVAQRGTDIDEAVQQAGPAGKRELDTLRRKYVIKSTTPESATDVTLARIAACFPNYVMMYLLKYPSGRGSTSRDLVAGHHQVPKEWRFSAACALIPQDREDAFNVWLEWKKAHDAIVHSIHPTYDSQHTITYAKLLWGNTIYSDEQRYLMLEGMGTTVVNEELRFPSNLEPLGDEKAQLVPIEVAVNILRVHYLDELNKGTQDSTEE
eukprot:Filipodium_phascolosomae@DN1863_c0_g1_i1.p1